MVNNLLVLPVCVKHFQVQKAIANAPLKRLIKVRYIATISRQISVKMQMTRPELSSVLSEVLNSKGNDENYTFLANSPTSKVNISRDYKTISVKHYNINYIPLDIFSALKSTHSNLNYIGDCNA